VTFFQDREEFEVFEAAFHAHTTHWSDRMIGRAWIADNVEAAARYEDDAREAHEMHARKGST
jgi:hypothetical protein